VISTTRLECDEPATKASELIRRQPGNSFGDFFNFHVTQYSTAEIWLGPLLGRTRHGGMVRMTRMDPERNWSGSRITAHADLNRILLTSTPSGWLMQGAIATGR
jgi:hypothetical protein